MKQNRQYDKINLRAIIENGGATLDKSGFDANFIRGYQVSKHDVATVKVTETDKIAREIQKLLRRISAREFVGVWVNDGLVYIDISEHINSRSAALRVGRARRQLSVFEWATGNCLEC